MKTAILLLAIIFSTATAAQDSASIKVPITLKADQHAIIISLIPKNSVEVINYIAQVAAGQDTAWNQDKMIPVNVPGSLIRDVYLIMGDQKERLTSDYNLAIKNALIPQVSNHSWVMRELGAIIMTNATQTAALVSAGAEYIMAAKQ